MKGVSVIVCCYNSAARLPETLRYLQQQRVRGGIPWEIILVDNASTDETTPVARSIWDTIPVTSFKIIEEKQPGLMHARKAGVEQSQYTLITFIDDDNWVSPEWVQTIYDLFESHPEIAACGGRSEPVFESSRPVWFEAYGVSYAAGTPFPESGFLKPGLCLWGAGFCIRREVWEALSSMQLPSLLSGRKGSQLTAGEDSEISLKLHLLQYKLWYEASLRFRHYLPASRLDPQKLIGMYEGFGRAEVVLRMYRSLLDPAVRIRTPWWRELFAGLFYYLKLALLEKGKFDSVPFGWPVKKAFVLGYLLELGRLRNEFDQTYHSLAESKKNLRRNENAKTSR